MNPFYIRWTRTFVGSCCMLGTFIAGVALSEEVMEEVVVTADSERSLTIPSLQQAQKELNSVPGGASIVDSDEVKKGRTSTLKDVLNWTPGVFVQPRFGAEESRLSIRGSGIQRTFHGRGIKLLQDGVPVNLADGGFDMQAIEPLASRYVEIHRGGNALIHGSTTLGGSINFVSQTGYTASPFSARVEYGSDETWRAQVSSGIQSGAFDLYLSASHYSMDGYRDHAQQNTQRYFLNFGLRPDEVFETRFFLTYVNTDSELPGALTPEEMEWNPRMANPGNVSLHQKRDFELFRLANRSTWSQGDHRLSLSTFWSYKDLKHPIHQVLDQVSNDVGLNVRYDYTGDLFGRSNELTLGLGTVFGWLEDNRYQSLAGQKGIKLSDAHQESWNVDLYLQNRFFVTDKFSLVLGAQGTYASRLSRDDYPVSLTNPDNSDRQEYWGFSPKVGVIWDITPDSQLFANVSHSYEPPSFGELTNAANNAAGLVQLDAQSSWTAEIGYRGRTDRVRWEVAYYHAWVENELISYEVSPSVTQTLNANRTIHQGIEAALDVDLIRGIFATSGAMEVETLSQKGGKTVFAKTVVPESNLDRLVLKQLYLWNSFHFDGDRTYGNNQLAGIPEHLYRAELVYEHPSGFYMGPNVEWVSGYNVDLAETLFADSHFLLGFKVGYRSEKGFSVFLEAKNLLDETYTATTGVITQATAFNRAQFFPGDGRGIYGGIEWRW